MLSLFGKSNPTKHPLYQVALSGGSDNIEAVLNETPAGVVVRVPVVMVMGERTRRAIVRHFLAKDQIAQIAEMAGVHKTITVTKQVVINDPAANRPKFCEHGHRQTSENIIHWPNGKEDCRTCYFSWPSTIAKKAREAERGRVIAVSNGAHKRHLKALPGTEHEEIILSTPKMKGSKK